MADLLETAGAAAALLEERGYVSVARKREGMVTVELWKIIGGRQHVLRHPVEDAVADARALADLGHARFEAALQAER
jgi:hypothetical protein